MVVGQAFLHHPMQVGLVDHDDVKHTFIHNHRDKFDVGVMCCVLGVTRAGFYASRTRLTSKREVRARELLEQIRIVHREMRSVCGSIRFTKELRHRKVVVNRKTIAKLMKHAGIRSKTHKRFRVRTTDSNHANPIAPNTLEQNFPRATAPNQVWGTDITYIETNEGFLYLAGVMDLYSRKIVGWSMSD